MRRIEIHPLSVALGIACAVAVSFAASPAQSPIMALLPGAHRISIVGPVTIDGIYDPSEAVVIKEGTPFTVPAGKVFVLTALGSLSLIGEFVEFRVDGVLEQIIPGQLGVKDAPQGMTAAASSTVSLAGTLGSGTARAWGYLVDA